MASGESGSLHFGRCNVNDLHHAVMDARDIASGDGVTTWAELDARDIATDVQ
jgi:hypothetical protein